jgi:PIN domain nuclease of toxin-antitoxin system
VILLDTHTLIWWLSNPEKLSLKAGQSIEQAINNNSLYVSSISAWEMAMLVQKGRLKLTMDVKDWIGIAESLPYLHFVPVNNRIALKSVFLPDFQYPDPADRIIIATAISLNAFLITKDSKILSYKHIKSVW